MSTWSSYFLKNNSLAKPLTGRRHKNPHWLGGRVTPHFTLFIFFFPLSKQTECWSSENMMLSHFSCRVFKLGLWERVWYNSMTEVIPLSIWALNGPLKYSLVRKNFSKWCFLIFFISSSIIIPFPTDYSLDLKMQFNHFSLPLRSGL